MITMKIAPRTYQPKQKPNKNKAIFWSEDRTIKQIKISSIPNTHQPAAQSFPTAHGRLVYILKETRNKGCAPQSSV